MPPAGDVGAASATCDAWADVRVDTDLSFHRANAVVLEAVFPAVRDAFDCDCIADVQPGTPCVDVQDDPLDRPPGVPDAYLDVVRPDAPLHTSPDVRDNRPDDP